MLGDFAVDIEPPQPRPLQVTPPGPAQAGLQAAAHSFGQLVGSQAIATAFDMRILYEAPPTEIESARGSLSLAKLHGNGGLPSIDPFIGRRSSAVLG